MNQGIHIIPPAHRALAELIGQIRQASDATRLAAIASTNFGDLEKNLKESTFCIAVLGPWNSGKSSLINRIIGEDHAGSGLLPVKDEPTTAKLTYLKFGETPELRKVDPRGDGPVLLASGELDVRRIIQEEAVKRERSSLMIQWPLEFCRAGGELVDTPGLFDPDEERSMVTLDALESFHAVIFVVPAPMPVNKDILRFIEEHFVRRTHAKFFFLVNKIDWLRGKDVTVEQFLDECHNDLTRELRARYSKLSLKGDAVPDVAHLLRRDRFFGISSKHGDGLEQACAAIRGFLSDGSSELVVVALLKANEVLRSLERAIDDEEQARHIERKQLDEPLVNLDEIDRKFHEHLKEIEISLPLDFSRATNKAGRRLRKLMGDLRDQGEEKLNFSFWEQITKADRIRAEMVALQRELIETSEDILHDVQRDLQQDIRSIVEAYHKDAIEPITNDLRRVAGVVDATLGSGPENVSRRLTVDGVPHGSMDADSEDEGVELQAAGAGLVAGGAGAALALGSGAAVTTSTAVVSTAAPWVPLWVAQTLGMTTTVATPVVTAGTLAMFIAAPAAAAAIAVYAILNMIKSSRSIKACRKFLGDLPGQHTSKVLENLEGEVQVMADSCLEGMRSYVGGMVARLREYIEHLRAASTEQKTPQELVDLARRIPRWREALDSIRSQSQ